MRSAVSIESGEDGSASAEEQLKSLGRQFLEIPALP